jgi:hypothetical protein
VEDIQGKILARRSTEATRCLFTQLTYVVVPDDRNDPILGVLTQQVVKDASLSDDYASISLSARESMTSKQRIKHVDSHRRLICKTTKRWKGWAQHQRQYLCATTAKRMPNDYQIVVSVCTIVRVKLFQNSTSGDSPVHKRVVHENGFECLPGISSPFNAIIHPLASCHNTFVTVMPNSVEAA